MSMATARNSHHRHSAAGPTGETAHPAPPTVRERRQNDNHPCHMRPTEMRVVRTSQVHPGHVTGATPPYSRVTCTRGRHRRSPNASRTLDRSRRGADAPSRLPPQSSEESTTAIGPRTARRALPARPAGSRSDHGTTRTTGTTRRNALLTHTAKHYNISKPYLSIRRWTSFTSNGPDSTDTAARPTRLAT